jgi:hypothetical protein
MQLSAVVLFVLFGLGIALSNDVGLDVGLFRHERLTAAPVRAPIRARPGPPTDAHVGSVTTAAVRQPSPRLPAAPTARGAGDFAVISTTGTQGTPDLGADAGRDYLDQVTLSPQDARYFDLVNHALPFSRDEAALLARNGFVASEAYQWPQFSDAYAWIYWQDLPVLVTTDSILQAVHQSYSDLLMSLELAVLIPQLRTVLQATRDQLATASATSAEPALTPLYADVEAYLAVALALLDGTGGRSAREKDWIGLATQAAAVSDVELVGGRYPVDFTLFQPRGHYAGDETLQRYFRAMTWLAQIDFRLLAFDSVGQPQANPEALAATAILRHALDDARQRETWETINALLEALVGPSDNMTLSDFERLWQDLQLSNPTEALALNEDRLTAQLLGHDYGQQRVTGQIVYRHVDLSDPAPVPRPVSFMLLGQRFALDAYVLGNLVYDRLIVDGQPVERAVPNPLDVIYALGNDRAVTHLSGELAMYGYAGPLADLRRRIDGLEPGFWHAPIYNQWLALIRTLNDPTLDGRYPQTMRTAAWADKVLQTQLAAWAQLRHDNILYVKQSLTVQIACEYPAGYVEPYPEFYAALGEYAAAGHRALSGIAPNGLPEGGPFVRERALTYFANVEQIAAQLRVMAEKELRQAAFTVEEEAFLKSIVKYQTETLSGGCGGPTVRELWDGWYMDLFYLEDDNPAVIADVHTNPNNDPASGLYPPSVLHVATGKVAPLFFLVDTDTGTTLYVGPAFTYYELTETGYPAHRLTDEAWRARLSQDDAPNGPAWTSDFRLPTHDAQQTLWLPGRDAARNGSIEQLFTGPAIHPGETVTDNAWTPQSPLLPGP